MVLASVRRDNDKHLLTQQPYLPRDNFERTKSVRFGLCYCKIPSSVTPVPKARNLNNLRTSPSALKNNLDIYILAAVHRGYDEHSLTHQHHFSKDELERKK